MGCYLNMSRDNSIRLLDRQYRFGCQFSEKKQAALNSKNMALLQSTHKQGGICQCGFHSQRSTKSLEIKLIIIHKVAVSGFWDIIEVQPLLLQWESQFEILGLPDHMILSRLLL